MKRKTCSTCAAWCGEFHIKSGWVSGECRANPPSATNNKFPTVDHDDWCLGHVEYAPDADEMFSNRDK